MSVVDTLKNIFAKKSSESDLDSRLSLAMPEDSSGVMGGDTTQESEAPEGVRLDSMLRDAEAPLPKASGSDLVSHPGLVAVQWFSNSAHCLRWVVHRCLFWVL